MLYKDKLPLAWSALSFIPCMSAGITSPVTASAVSKKLSSSTMGVDTSIS